jgi:hypothetical protein
VWLHKNIWYNLFANKIYLSHICNLFQVYLNIQTNHFMQSKITFKGDPGLIARIADAASEIFMDWETAIDPSSPQNQQSFAAAQTAPSPATPPAKVKARETAAEKKKREAEEKANAAAVIAQQALGQAVPVDPNAAAVQQIQQQAQWAQQNPMGIQAPTQSAPASVQQPFPAAPAPQTAIAQPFATPQPAQAPVDTTGQAWLSPTAVNAAPGPTLNDIYGLINQFASDNNKRTILTNWMQQRLGQGVQLEQLAGQPAILAETYGVVMQILTGEKSA